jgi:hypothetical protein
MQVPAEHGDRGEARYTLAKRFFFHCHLRRTVNGRGNPESASANQDNPQKPPPAETAG